MLIKKKKNKIKSQKSIHKYIILKSHHECEFIQAQINKIFCHEYRNEKKSSGMKLAEFDAFLFLSLPVNFPFFFLKMIANVIFLLKFQIDLWMLFLKMITWLLGIEFSIFDL